MDSQYADGTKFIRDLLDSGEITFSMATAMLADLNETCDRIEKENITKKLNDLLDRTSK